MKKSHTAAGVLVLVLLAVAMGCATLTPRDQMRFGIEAARNQLWDEAIFRWKKILRNDPNSASAHNNLAVAYEKKGMWDEAEDEYQVALKLSPQNDRIQSNYTKFKKNRDDKEDPEDEAAGKDKKIKGEGR